MKFDFRPGLENIKSYSVEEKEWDVKLDANESPHNLPPLVRERVMNQLEYLAFHRYPEMGMRELRTQIAENFNLSIQNVQIGSGSSELIMAVCHAFGGAGRSIVFPVPSFSMYAIYAQVTDSIPVPVQLNEDYSVPRDKVLERAKDANAKLIILCNPNNPTGTVMPTEDIEYIVSNAQCPVLIDEAYFEFYGESAVGLLKEYDNVIITRTFSKAYGLAAARVGYVLGSASIIAMLEKVLMPYHVNALSLATAEVLYQMRDEFMPSLEQIISERQRLASSLEDIPGIKVYPSETNFILLKTLKSKELSSALATKNIGIRDFSTAPGLLNCIRITVGTPLENDELLQAIVSFMKEGA